MNSFFLGGEEGCCKSRLHILPCSSENLGVAEADVRSCRQLNLLTCIRPCKKLKVNAEDSEMPPKSLLKETYFKKC